MKRDCSRCKTGFESDGEAICSKCRDYMRRWRALNHDRELHHGRTYWMRNKTKLTEKKVAWQKTEHGKAVRKRVNKAYKVRLRLAMIAAYGGCCQRCGEKRYEFLTLEHVGGGGGKERKLLGVGGVLTKLRRAGWPKEGYTILCWNCNLSTRFGETCPHELERQGAVA